MKWTGNNCYTILPAQQAEDAFYQQQQLDRLESATEHQRVAKLLWKQESHARPPVSRCVPRSWEGQRPCPSQRVQVGFRPLSPSLEKAPPILDSLRREKERAEKIKMPHLPAVRWTTWGRQQQPVGGQFYPPHGWGKQSVWLAASGSQTPFCGRKPAPTFSALRGQLITF